MNESNKASTEFVQIPLCEPELRGREWEYVKECLDENWLTAGGPMLDRFQGMVAEFVGANHGVAASSGTAALHIALLVAGVQPDDEVLVSTLTFIAPTNAVRYVGAWPVFIDSELGQWQMDHECVQDFLEEQCETRGGETFNRATGRRVSAVLPVHILGHPCDMDPIVEVARRYGLKVIEDATESLGAKYKGEMAGHLGDIACFSFNGNKLITTAGGGMIVTDDAEWARRAGFLINQAKDDPIEYVHSEIGYNYRLSSLQAAVGCAQMESIDEYVQKKREIARRYQESLAGIAGLESMEEASWADSAFWMFTVLVDPDGYGMDSRQLLRELDEAGIQTRPLWQPGHQSRAHAGSPSQINGTADEIHQKALSLPCSVGLGRSQQDRVLRALASLAGRPGPAGS